MPGFDKNAPLRNTFKNQPFAKNPIMPAGSTVPTPSAGYKVFQSGRLAGRWPSFRGSPKAWLAAAVTAAAMMTVPAFAGNDDNGGGPKSHLKIEGPNQQELSDAAANVNPIMPQPDDQATLQGKTVNDHIAEFGRKYFSGSSQSDAEGYMGAGAGAAGGGLGAYLSGGNGLVGTAGGAGLGWLANYLMSNTQGGRNFAQSTGINPAILSALAGTAGGVGLSHFLGGGGRSRRDADDDRPRRPYGLA